MAGKPTSRYDVANLDQWGRLVKSWATELDYVSQAENKQPPRVCWVNKTWPNERGRTPAPKTITDRKKDGSKKPWCLPDGGPVEVKDADGGEVTLPFAVAITVEQFKTLVTAAGVSITNFPEEYENVVIVQGDRETMVIRLPPREMLQKTEDDLLNGVAYTMRSFYWALFGTAPNMPKPTEQARIMELHANRIGEYTLNNCG
jgi:hypothetical protein